ncbi:ATP synthase F1, epsilon subunit [Gemella bergeri ATCC 700627]|uniref:ATP synthase epsilon chain n=1 Tax=Gemella bergeri ATCC 700627 TaxID=1321820 RepID=U2S796_9BACL|nr:F0F1 ATP synthase subunit epsilon [Gemella bergeri]ERK58697.1 ATP synthase F1, epsilon subunit [Gemella bergeri ATCC 700627]
MNTLNVSIVTPNGEVYSTKDASMVVLGTTSGQLGIMANHVPMVASLAIGPLKVVFPDGKEERIAVSEGFVETHKNDITVIVQTAECADDIDVERAKRAKERAEKRLSERKSTLDVRRAELALARALARLKVTEK